MALQLARLQPDQQAKVPAWALENASQLHRYIESETLITLRSFHFDLDDAALLPEAGTCTACPKRTGNAPLLFADVRGGDICTDLVCLRKKVAADIERKRKAEDLVQITERSDGRNKAGLIYRWSATLSPTAKKGAVKGIYIDGENVGAFAWVQPPEEGRVGRPDPSLVRQRKAAKAAIEATAIRREVLRHLLLAATEKKYSTKDELDLLATCWRRSENETKKLMLQHLDWKLPKDQYRSTPSDDRVAAHIATLDASQRIRLSLLLAHAWQIRVWQYDAGGSKKQEAELFAAARRYGVRPEGIAARMRAASAAKAKGKGKGKAKAKPKTKGKA